MCYSTCIMNDSYPTVPAVIVDYPDSPQVTIGHNVSVLCSASGIPLPNIMWSREGQSDNVNSSRLVLLSRVLDATHIISELTLRDAERQDDGQYSCTASNDIGTHTENFYLQVQGMYVHSFSIAICVCCLPSSTHRATTNN